jgi:hypothetical protein
MTAATLTIVLLSLSVLILIIENRVAVGRVTVRGWQ